MLLFRNNNVSEFREVGLHNQSPGDTESHLRLGTFACIVSSLLSTSTNTRGCVPAMSIASFIDFSSFSYTQGGQNLSTFMGTKRGSIHIGFTLDLVILSLVYNTYFVLKLLEEIQLKHRFSVSSQSLLSASNISVGHRFLGLSSSDDCCHCVDNLLMLLTAESSNRKNIT